MDQRNRRHDRLMLLEPSSYGERQRALARAYRWRRAGMITMYAVMAVTLAAVGYLTASVATGLFRVWPW